MSSFETTKSSFANMGTMPIAVVGSSQDFDSLKKMIKSLDFVKPTHADSLHALDHDARAIIFLVDFTNLIGLQVLTKFVQSLEGHPATKIGVAMAPINISNEELLFGVELDIRRTFYGVKRDEELKQFLKQRHLENQAVGEIAYIEREVRKALVIKQEHQINHWREKLAGMDRDSEDVNRLLSLIYETTGDQKRMVFHLKQTLTVNPQNLWAANKLGSYFLKNNQAAEGIAILRKMSRFHELNGERLFVLGQALLNSGRIDEAQATLTRGDELSGHTDPKFTEALAKVDVMQGRPADALSRLGQKYLSQAILSYLNTRAVLAVRSGQLSEGLSIYEQAIKGCDPDAKIVKAKVHFNQGIAFFKNAQPHMAEQAFFKSMELGGKEFSRAEGPLKVAQKQAAIAKKIQMAKPQGPQGVSNVDSKESPVDFEFESVY